MLTDSTELIVSVTLKSGILLSKLSELPSKIKGKQQLELFRSRQRTHNSENSEPIKLLMTLHSRCTDCLEIIYTDCRLVSALISYNNLLLGFQFPRACLIDNQT